MFDIFDLHTKLTDAAWPSGFESQGRLIASLAEPFADEVTTDALGNVTAHKKGDGPKLILPAHMDVLGLIVTHIGTDGFPRFDTIGGMPMKELLSAPFVLENGLYCAARITGKAKREAKSIGDFTDKKDMYLDFGRIDGGKTAESVVPGMVGKYATKPVRFGKKIMAAPYADDLICCAAMLLALESLSSQKVENDLYFTFTVQEEVGLRGAKTAAYHIEPDVCIVADVCGSRDNYAEKHPDGAKLGQGPAIKMRDGGSISHGSIVSHLTAAAKDIGIPFQYEAMVFGGTDQSAVQKTRGGALSSGVSIPTRYIHSPYEVVALEDVYNAARLIAAAAKKRIVY